MTTCYQLSVLVILALNIIQLRAQEPLLDGKPSGYICFEVSNVKSCTTYRIIHSITGTIDSIICEIEEFINSQ